MLSSDMARHADTEMTVMKKEAFYIHRSLETGGLYHAGPHGEIPGRSGGREDRGKCEHESLFWFLQAVGKLLWGRWAVPSFLVPGPG